MEETRLPVADPSEGRIPVLVQIVSFSCSFWQNNRLAHRTHLVVGAPTREILHPPLITITVAEYEHLDLYHVIKRCSCHL